MASTRRRSPWVLVMVAGLLGGCGSAGTSAGSSAEPQPQPPTAVTTSPEESPDSAPSPSAADGPTFGVDRTSWPDSMAAAQTLLAAMPDELGGEARELMLADGDAAQGALAGVSYGGERLLLLVSDGSLPGGPEAAPQVVGAHAKLASLFGLVYACDMDTYEGSIEPMANYPGPGQSGPDAATPAWFSCRIAGAEGADDYSGQAVGWTTADQVAWLAVGPDDAAVRTLVTAAQEAAG